MYWSIGRKILYLAVIDNDVCGKLDIPTTALSGYRKPLPTARTVEMETAFRQRQPCPQDALNVKGHSPIGKPSMALAWLPA
jgi:hypothetical protein